MRQSAMKAQSKTAAHCSQFIATPRNRLMLRKLRLKTLALRTYRLPVKQGTRIRKVAADLLETFKRPRALAPVRQPMIQSLSRSPPSVRVFAADRQRGPLIL